MLTQECLGTSKLGGRVTFFCGQSVVGWQIRPKVLLNKQQHRRTRRESEICRFQDGL
jgi:hypothetical protein